MDLDSVLSNIQEKDPVAWEILSICSAFDCSLPIPIWIFLQPSAQLIELPDDTWSFTYELSLHQAAETLHESGIAACIENDGHTPWIDFKGGKFVAEKVGEALRHRFLESASDEAATALLSKIMKSTVNVFPQFYTQDQFWKVSKSFGTLLHCFILSVWDNWRNRMPSLIDETFTLCCTGMIAHLVHLAKFDKVDKIVEILTELKQSSHPSYTERTEVFQSAGTCLLYLDATEQHREATVQAVKALKIMQDKPKLFGPFPQARLLHILARSQLAEESMTEALESITLSAQLIKVDIETLLNTDMDTMLFNWETPMHMVAYLMHLMGTFNRLKHRLDAAQRWYTKAMMLKLRAFGRQHPSTQSTAIFLAESMLQRGAEGVGEDGIREADDILRAAHSVLSQELGSHHELTLYCRQDLAEALWQMKKYSAACAMTEDVYEVTKKIYGDKSSHTLLALRRYAKMLQNCGEQDKSYHICLVREKACREVFGSSSYTTIEAICDTALTALFLKKNTEAVNKANEALGFAEAQYGPTHQFCAYPIDVLARCRYMADELDSALELFKRRLAMCDKTDPDYYTTQQSISVIYETTGRLDEAEEIYHQTIQLLTADDAPKDAITTSDLAFAHAGLSMILATRGRYVEAEAEARRSLELYESSFPPGNPIVGAAMEKLARCVVYQSRWDEAEELATKALEILLPSIGADAPESISCKQLLESIAIARKGTGKMGFGSQAPAQARSSSSSSQSTRRGKNRKTRDNSSSTALLYTVGIVAGAVAGIAAVLLIRALKKSSDK